MSIIVVIYKKSRYARVDYYPDRVSPFKYQVFKVSPFYSNRWIKITNYISEHQAIQVYRKLNDTKGLVWK